MKKIVFLIAPFLLLAMAHCSSMKKTKVGGKQVVAYNQWGIGILTLGGAPLSKCLEKMDKEGVDELIESMVGGSTGGVGAAHFDGGIGSTSHRISTFTEICQAAGYVK